MNLLIDNNDGRGLQDYTAYVDADHLPKIARRLNAPATMTVALLAADSAFQPPVSGARVVLERGDGFRLFTGYLATAPEQQHLGYGYQGAASRYLLEAIDDSCLLELNPLPARTPFALRSAGDALLTLTNDVLPGGLDLSGVQDVSTINQFPIASQRNWSEHAEDLANISRATYRVHDGKLWFQPVGESSFTISEQDPNFDPTRLTLSHAEQLRNDITVVGETEPLDYARDYFLGNGTTLGFYLSESPFIRTTSTIFQDDYTAAQLQPTLWSVMDPNHRVTLSGGQLQLNGGPAAITYVEQLELAGGLMLQHGQFVFRAASSGTIGGIYNGTSDDPHCVAGFKISPNGSNCSIQALINGTNAGPALTTTPGHVYSFATQLFCNEAHRVRQTYLSSTHPAGNGRGGDAIAAAIRVVLSVHDVDPNNPGTIGAPATVLYDNVLSATPGFATYALINESSFFAGVSFTRLQHIVDAEIRSIIPGGQFRTRLTGAFADGGECYITSSGELYFYPPYPPEPDEQVVVAYRSSGRAMARVQDQNSIAQHAHGSDGGRRIYVRHLTQPSAPTSIDCENACLCLLDDSVEPAWAGECQVVSDFLPVGDIIPSEAVEVSVPSRGAAFTAIVREVDVQVLSLADDCSNYAIKFANEAAEPVALQFENVTLPAPLTTIYTTTMPSSSLYIPSLTAAVITDVIATEITVDAGVNPPPGGGIEVRRSDGGWGPASSGNIAGRFTTRTFILPRLSRVQGYYLRQYDGSSPAKYSRYSTLLHINYPW